MTKIILIVFLLLIVFALLILWIVYIGEFWNLSFFKLRYRMLSLFSTPEKMDKLNEESIENAKKNNEEITIIIHGAAANYYKDIYGTASWFRERGVDVVSFDYNYKDVPDVSAKNLGEYIEGVLKKTNTEKVNIIGITIGGILAKYYAEKYDGAKKIDKLITVLSPVRPVSENDFGYKINKMFVFDLSPWNKVLEYIEDKNPVEKHLYIYSKNDSFIPEKYQVSENGNFIGFELKHSPLISVDPEILDPALNFINGN